MESERWVEIQRAIVTSASSSARRVNGTLTGFFRARRSHAGKISLSKIL